MTEEEQQKEVAVWGEKYESNERLFLGENRRGFVL